MLLDVIGSIAAPAEENNNSSGPIIMIELIKMVYFSLMLLYYSETK